MNINQAYITVAQHYKKLLDFAKFCAEHASCHVCEYQSLLASKVLKEIGEL